MAPLSRALFFAVAAIVHTCGAAPSFTIANDSFILDGAPYIMKSGSLHYFRVQPSLWADRLARA